MKANKRIDSSTLDEVVDATEEITIIVRLRHCELAVPGDPERCALVLAAKEQHDFSGFHVHRTIAYARRAGAVRWYRYQSTLTTRRFVEAYDQGDFSSIPPEGRAFTFKPPRPAVRLDHLRSRTRTDYERARVKRVRSEPPRPYRLPDPKTLAGVRNRFGFKSKD